MEWVQVLATESKTGVWPLPVRSEITGVTFPMIHAELFPSPAEIPALQQALDASELTENELILLLAAGPRLAESSDPLNDLHDAVAADSLPGGDERHQTRARLSGCWPRSTKQTNSSGARWSSWRCRTPGQGREWSCHLRD